MTPTTTRNATTIETSWPVEKAERTFFRRDRMSSKFTREIPFWKSQEFRT
jgi:hypothetical protein